jgi:hypothetical protein
MKYSDKEIGEQMFKEAQAKIAKEREDKHRKDRLIREFI